MGGGGAAQDGGGIDDERLQGRGASYRPQLPVGRSPGAESERRRISGDPTWTRRGSTAPVRCRTSRDEEAQIILQVCAPDLLRLRLVPPGESLERGSLMLVRETFPRAAFTVRETPDRVTVQTSRLRVELAKDPWELSIRDARGRVICRENRSDTNLRGTPRVRFLGYARDASGQVARVHEAFFLAPDECLYGFGEKFTPMDKRGQRIDCWNFNTWGTTNERAYKNVPF
ncbi:MAG: DUF4968 domain-containing protein, partial [candidate division NC10 bacterium]|nr:DUF4968 domain-containing protein [candidate division NC10 bacterium]